MLYVGLRADERRSGYISTKENIRAVFPFKEDGIDKAAVMRILDESGVGLPSYNGIGRWTHEISESHDRSVDIRRNRNATESTHRQACRA